MKRLLAILGAIIVLTLVLVWLLKPRAVPAGFSVGPALPPGKVTPQLVSTWDTGILLAPDGSLWGWGGNQFQLNGLFPKPGVYSQPQRFNVGSDWRRVSGSWTHILALKSDGTLWGWGANSSGQLAQPKTNTTIPKPVQIGGDNDWADVSAGAGHSLAIKKDGSIWAWGQNESGQVGNGSATNIYTPTRVSPDAGWRSVAAGAFNGYALKSDGAVWGWGLDFVSGGSGKTNNLTPVQIDPGTNWSRISASDYVLLALKFDGTLWIRGQNASWSAAYYVKSPATNFVQIGTDTDWQDISAGQSFFFARKRDGSWWACGDNNRGELGFGPRYSRPTGGALQRVPFNFDPWAFSTGYGTTLLLTRDGTLWTWGERLGSDSPTSTQRMKRLANQVINIFPGHLGRFSTKALVTDNAPCRLWELPGSIRRAPGTNEAGLRSNASNP